MSDTIASLGPTSDSTYGQGRRQKSSSENSDHAGSDHDRSDLPDPADLRLIIEDDQTGEPPVYTTVDRRTGAVVQKLPGEQVLRLGQAETYVAGQLIKTRA